MIEQAEGVLRDAGFREVRVRHHEQPGGALAKIELGQAEIEAADLPAGLLEAAHIDSVRLAKGSPVIDQRIGELDLRANTGVSIVGIERDGERIVNPGPEETLLEGDRLLLLGEDTKLPKAKTELNG